MERTEVSSDELNTGICPATGGNHRVMVGMTGDMLPQFCVANCGYYSNEFPPDEVMENL